jgi:hypothetical protein
MSAHDADLTRRQIVEVCDKAIELRNSVLAILAGLEGSRLNLQGTELVILSACDSGTGQVQIGEGVVSLRRALPIARADSAGEPLESERRGHQSVDDSHATSKSSQARTHLAQSNRAQHRKEGCRHPSACEVRSLFLVVVRRGLRLRVLSRLRIVVVVCVGPGISVGSRLLTHVGLCRYVTIRLHVRFRFRIG